MSYVKCAVRHTQPCRLAWCADVAARRGSGHTFRCLRSTRNRLEPGWADRKSRVTTLTPRDRGGPRRPAL